jgi:Tfp pilus assembly protein PilO
MTLWRRIVTEKRRIVVLLALAALVNVALFGLVVVPLSKRVAGGEVNASNAAAALAAARQDLAAARATVTGKATADAELRKFYGDLLPPDQSGARRIMYLRMDQLAAQTDLRLARGAFTASTDRESTLGKLTYSVSLSGEYSAVRRFIHALETAPEFLVLENVGLAAGDDRSRGINMTVQVATYYRAGGDGD